MDTQDTNTSFTDQSIPQEVIQQHTEEVVTFVDQGHTVSDQALALSKPLSSSYLNTTIDSGNASSLYSFLQRPVRLYTGLFTSTQTVAQILWTGTFPDQLFKNPMYAEKISGFTGFRAGLEIKIQVNAQKFQQGRLCLYFIPYAEHLGSTRVDSINATLSGRTSCPRVDIDICGGSTPESRIAEGVLTVPYISPHVFMNLVRGYGTFGTFYLMVYSPLKTGAGGTDCDVSVWARFIDPELSFPTAAPPIEKWLPTSVRMKAQVKGEALQVAKTGVVSSTLGHIGEAISSIKKVPLIGKYMAIPEWLTTKGMEIAKFFGFSKPGLPMDVKLRTTNCMANYNGKDSSHKMALSASNEIDTPSGIGGTDLDEMALSSIIGVPAYWDSFNWKSTDIPETIIYATPNTPYLIKPASNYPNHYQTVPLGYVASVFRQWRGSIVYTLKMVKTGFHSGRLRIYYIPYGDPAKLPVGGLPDPSILVERNYQMIVDIAETDVVSFTVPYVSSKPWMVRNSLYSSTGILCVSVLNSLRQPDAVSNNIDIIVEVNAGSDFSFACPKECEFLPTKVPTQAIESRMKAQVAGTALDKNRIQSQLLMDPKSISQVDPTENWSPESHCVGEKVLSVRQLIKRNCCIGIVNTRPANVASNMEVPLVNPFNFAMASLETDFSGQTCGDYIAFFGMLYAFFRGSMRIKVSTRNIAANTAAAAQSDSRSLIFRYFPQVSSALTQFPDTTRILKITANLAKTILVNASNPLNYLTPYPFLSAVPTVVSNQQVEGMHEVEVPYYNSTHLSVIRGNTVSDPVFSTFAQDLEQQVNPTGGLMIMQPPTSVAQQFATHVVYRSGGDDFGFHYLIGVPLLVRRVGADSTLTDYLLPTSN